MLRNIIELVRGRMTDYAKAQAYLRLFAAETYGSGFGANSAAALDDQDTPSITIGTARGPDGDAVPVNMSAGYRGHATILGTTGSGKTKSSEHQFAERLWLGGGVGEVDFKNDLHPTCLRWAGAYAYELPEAQRPAFIRRLAIVNPFAADALPPFNVCQEFAGWSREVQAYEVTKSLSRLFDQGLTFHGENVLRHLLILLMEQRLSLVEAPDVLQDELLRAMLVEHSRNDGVREFFHRTYAEVPLVAKQALCTRLQSLLLPENVRLMLGADSIIDLRTILDRGQPLLAFFGKGGGVPEEQAEMLAGLFLNLFFQAAYSTSGRTRPYTMMLDEFFHILTPALTRRFNSALTTLRSYGVNLMLILHTFSQVEASLRETILGNCDALGIFRTSGKNAEWLGDFLPNHDPELAAAMLRRSGEFPSSRTMRAAMIERLQRLPNRQCFWYDRRQPHRAILMRVPDVPEPHEAVRLSAGELDRFIQDNAIHVGGYALPKTVLRGQIAARQERLRQLMRPPIRLAAAAAPAHPTVEVPRMKRRPRLG